MYRDNYHLIVKSFPRSFSRKKVWAVRQNLIYDREVLERKSFCKPGYARVRTATDIKSSSKLNKNKRDDDFGVGYCQMKITFSGKECGKYKSIYIRIL